MKFCLWIISLIAVAGPATKIFAHRVFAAVRRSVSQMIADKGLARRTVHRIK